MLRLLPVKMRYPRFHYRFTECFESFQCSKPLIFQFQHSIKYLLSNYQYLDSIIFIQLTPAQKRIYLMDDFYIDLKALD